MLEIWTGRIGNGVLDTTVKSGCNGGELLAPTWEIVGGSKARKAIEMADSAMQRKWARYAPISEQQYRERYLEIVRERYRTNKRGFLALLQGSRIVVGCYCPKGQFCHRYIAAEILMKIATAQGIEARMCGEVS